MSNTERRMDIRVESALKGNFELIKPLECQRKTDETYGLEYTEDQLDTSILSTDTDGYNTAHSKSNSENEYGSDSELESFIRAEIYVNSLPDDLSMHLNFEQTNHKVSVIEKKDSTNLNKKEKNEDAPIELSQNIAKSYLNKPHTETEPENLFPDFPRLHIAS